MKLKNKGFTVPEMAGVMIFFFFVIILVAIFAQKNFKGVLDSDEETSKTSTSSINQEKDDYDSEDTMNIDTSKYSELEDKLKISAQKYINDKNINKKIVISSSTLIEQGYLDKIIDPNDYTNECYGYVEYDTLNYNSYIRCINNYSTDNYNIDNE